ncbi:hypothetical protein CLOHIR_02241 [Peptacetobacter hiranonis DSM 13275]|uniref:Uncharacterized protein n=1 Tax=Peptacetobacter hiranonis (strain DSM 13275 / JCM 10541 / KCTC 15199 / TO-931) TaxID=500633 RepID=B6G279_PEPHT|nr:hypothetical protein CLOHIR_02241 [Peptacetobacter hiranonis DSM 13275]
MTDCYFCNFLLDVLYCYNIDKDKDINKDLQDISKLSIKRRYEKWQIV